MKKIVNIVLLTIILAIDICSCRHESEDLWSYQNMILQNDTTFAEQFRTFWTYMDHNYPIWDYEASFGLNWDEVFKKYLPKFEEHDKSGKFRYEVEDLYSELLRPLHDGHFKITIRHPKPNYVLWPFEIMPQYMRNKESRLDFNSPSPSREKLLFYEGHIKDIYPTDILKDNYYCIFSDNIIYYRPRESVDNIICNSNDEEEGKTWQEMFASIQELYNKKNLKGIIIDLRNFTGGNADNFHYLIGALQPINPTQNYHRLGWIRQKDGIGRYDYTPKMPFLFKKDEMYQLNVTDVPIVMLSNCITGSLGELVCLAAKQINNGCVIGMRSWGGLSPLYGDVSGTINSDSIHKMPSTLGEENGNYSVYAKVPVSAFFTDDGEILEGKGVTPDIEVQLDIEDYETTGRDTQLERALEFIRTGK